jgi:hypothetical protein
MAVSVEAAGDNLKAAQPHELFTAQLVKVHHTTREFDVKRRAAIPRQPPRRTEFRTHHYLCQLGT